MVLAALAAPAQEVAAPVEPEAEVQLVAGPAADWTCLLSPDCLTRGSCPDKTFMMAGALASPEALAMAVSLAALAAQVARGELLVVVTLDPEPEAAQRAVALPAAAIFRPMEAACQSPRLGPF